MCVLGANAEILYSLLDSADGVFSIEEETGVVRLDRPLDRELQSLYTLRAQATDRGSPRRLSSHTTVSVSILDINDNPPVFERREYTATVTEDIPVGTQVLRVHAASRDTEAGTEITYAIINGNERGAFRVDPQTGEHSGLGETTQILTALQHLNSQNKKHKIAENVVLFLCCFINKGFIHLF